MRCLSVPSLFVHALFHTGIISALDVNRYLSAANGAVEGQVAQIIDGKATAAAIREELKAEVDKLREQHSKVRTL